MTGPHDHPPELPCRDLVEVVTAYLEDALSPLDRRRFEEHLAECDACEMYVEQIRETIAASGRSAVLADALPADVRDGIRSAFRGWSS